MQVLNNSNDLGEDLAVLPGSADIRAVRPANQTSELLCRLTDLSDYSMADALVCHLARMISDERKQSGGVTDGVDEDEYYLACLVACYDACSVFVNTILDVAFVFDRLKQ